MIKRINVFAYKAEACRNISPFQRYSKGIEDARLRKANEAPEHRGIM